MDETLARSWKQVEQIIATALSEDFAHCDITTEAVIPPDVEGRASILVKAGGTLAGIEVAQAVFGEAASSARGYNTGDSRLRGESHLVPPRSQ